MTPEQLRAARLSLGLTQGEMGQMLDYKGKRANQQVDKMERGKRNLGRLDGRMTQAYLDGYRPKDWPEVKGQE